MWRFSPVLRIAVSVAFALAIAPIALHYALGANGEVLGALARSTWIAPTAAFLGGLAAGVWADCLVRRFDVSRQAERKGFGTRLTQLAEEIARRQFAQTARLADWPKNIGDARRPVAGALMRMEKFGLWNPGRAAFAIPRGGEFLIDFFREIGALLQDERFEEARTRAHAAKLRFELIGSGNTR
jgi:hypothetical protein